MLKKHPFVALVSILAIRVAGFLSIQAAVVSMNPGADAFVTTGPANNLATNNSGGGGSLALSATGSANGEFQSVLRFDTSAAKNTFDGLYGTNSWSLQSVTLQLSASAVNNAIFNANNAGSFGVSWMQNDGWTEGSGTPSAPGTSGITSQSLQSTFINPGADEALGTFSYDGSSAGTFIYALSISPNLAADLLAGDSVSLRLSGADSAVSFLFNSRSFGTVANRPLLGITAVPEPGVLALFALAGLLCAIRKWMWSRH